MLGAALVAFGHFLAFFALTAAIVVELTLLRMPLTAADALRIQRADRIAGISAILLFAFGLSRVFQFEKGAAFYADNAFFWAKMLLFLAVWLVSLYPTVVFIRWGRRPGAGEAPSLDDSGALRLRRCLHWELVLIGGMVFCASMMAKGYG